MYYYHKIRYENFSPDEFWLTEKEASIRDESTD
jgi:hypothetical protein